MNKYILNGYIENDIKVQHIGNMKQLRSIFNYWIYESHLKRETGTKPRYISNLLEILEWSNESQDNGYKWKIKKE